MIGAADKAAYESKWNYIFFFMLQLMCDHHLKMMFFSITWSLHTRRTQIKFLFEHLQRRHGSVDGIIEVSANIELLWKQPGAIEKF